MRSINGFGTVYYGWRHAADGTATATRWVALSWLPVWPLGRDHLRVLTDFRQPPPLTRSWGGLAVGQVTEYFLLARTPLVASEVLRTLAAAYLGLPLLVVGPLALLVILGKVLPHLGIPVRPGTPALTGLTLGVGLTILHALYQVLRVIRRAKGWQPEVRTGGRP